MKKQYWDKAWYLQNVELHNQVMVRLRAAMETDDCELLYCLWCRGVVGWKGHVFSHGCEQQGYAFGWTDMRRDVEVALVSYEVPGTLWA
jgi:hypothetical protein